MLTDRTVNQHSV